VRCLPTEYRRTVELIQTIGCANEAIGSEICAQRKKKQRIETTNSGFRQPSDLGN